MCLPAIARLNFGPFTPVMQFSDAILGNCQLKIVLPCLHPPYVRLQQVTFQARVGCHA